MSHRTTIEDELASLGLKNLGDIHWNLSAPLLFEHAVRGGEGVIAEMGAFIVHTGKYTGRAVKDKFIVHEPSSRDKIWWGDFNKAMPEADFDALYAQVCRYLEGRRVFVTDCIVGAHSKYAKPVRVISQNAWHALFARTMFLPPADLGHEVAVDGSAFTVVHVPEFHAEPGRDKTNSGAFVLLHLGRRLVLIGGTAYAGEIKKSIFTIMNYLLPEAGVLPMHAAANMNRAGEVAIFFGLSGTGKTTLSSDDERTLIGDDEHGWSAHGIFNFEGGCYAKVIRLSKENEPLIYEATQRFGAILENVRVDPDTRRIDFDDETITENTRAAYPISTHVPNAIYPGAGGQPTDIVMLTADAFGVLPPIARLTPEQAMYYFILGYTAKVAGTEAGVTEPSATFSPCFGAPFMALHPGVYARLLGRNIRTYNVRCWLVNTGWKGGPYGVGNRMELPYTRRMVHAALNGELDSVPFMRDDIFGLSIPQSCRGLPTGVLNPAEAWQDGDAYRKGARALAEAFQKQFAGFVDEAPAEAKEGAPLWGRL